MNENDYLRRRKALEAAMEEAVEQVRTGYRAQIRALDLAWLASPDNLMPVPAMLDRLLASAPPGAGERALPGHPAPLALAPAPPPQPPAPVKKRWPRGGLREEILAVLPQMPDEFDRAALTRRLSGEPDRSTICRILGHLAWSGVLEVVEHGHQHIPTRYRRKAPPSAAAVQG